MKIRSLLACVVVIATLAAAGPAGADKPERFEDSVTFVDVNPCTGLDHEVTINFEIALHEHGQRNVVNIKRSGSTDDGYQMTPGSREHVTVNDSWIIGSFRDKWSDGDGSAFRAQGRIKIVRETGEPIRDDFDLFCTS